MTDSDLVLKHFKAPTCATPMLPDQWADLVENYFKVDSLIYYRAVLQLCQRAEKMEAALRYYEDSHGAWNGCIAREALKNENFTNPARGGD